MQNLTIVAYCVYLPISIMLTIWVARTLFTNGRIFLLEIFHGNKELADSVNKLLLVGFYLINAGYILYIMTISEKLNTPQDVMEMLSKKIGLIILVLGFMHFFNMYILFRGKKKSRENELRRLQIERSEN
ncbi:MAG: hypothetical protein KBF42_06265 [Chitinophagales bacterium]|jgi:hypothetical protein|nr:hypothetical protein [Bacteroidota bacterium]MBK7567066.1 hypothetical protein [Bacteroidota bacterium]MBP8917019.1 hypothetical protein [Chitinophagales bacterium]MBP9220968.1 hypothetical protein [Chitinophagales bacterium]MBP9795318.1 hypothetical protein [Chitinophagales bacterium]